ncbi:FAD-dependent oxidoreductase [Sphingomonas lutea]|uniref:FAD-dependent oxidoreductase n=1 Tax=Sphingomonas lutea TaxID=1045317 RepID=A0A7G9SKQ9_9SPHN|nr:FAD-dependent oxidoreductase [Sphingomonas lutea]QNN68434.1 FAD-dependent oxidoreductase [Sphingomonas lutea]
MSAVGNAERIVVVGAGAFGAWTAHHLHQRGHRVALVEAHSPAHSRASSGGESRLIRAGYGRDAIYTRMAWDSLPQWKALSDQAGLPIFIPGGVLFFSNVRDDYFDGAVEVHRELGLPIEELGRAELQRRFPMIDFDGVAVGLHEPGFGVLMARRAVQALVERFVRDGGTFLEGAVEPPAGDRLDTIRLAGGERISGDRFVFAAGPWLPKLFPDVIGARIRPTRQEVFYFAARAGENDFSPAALPGWADFSTGDLFYGTPDIEGRGVKFAHDAHGPPVDPDTQDRRPSDSALAEVISFRDRRFPELRGAPLIGAEVCQYENSSNGDFLIDLHPRWDNVLLVGGGSGHGFKHGPEVGRYAAARLFGSADPEPRFSLATKSETHQREVH